MGLLRGFPPSLAILAGKRLVAGSAQVLSRLYHGRAEGPRGLGLRLDGPDASDHPLMAPADSPRTKWRWARIATSDGGTSDRDATAARVRQTSPRRAPSPRRSRSPTAWSPAIWACRWTPWCSAIKLSDTDARLLGETPGAPALMVCSVLRNRRGVPVEQATTIYRADRYSFNFTITKR